MLTRSLKGEIADWNNVLFIKQGYNFCLMSVKDAYHGPNSTRLSINIQFI